MNTEHIISKRDMGEYAAVIVPVVSIILSELLLSYSSTSNALWGYFVTLLVYTTAPLYLGNTRVFQAFALIPVFRLVNLGMPVFANATVYWLASIYIVLIPTVYIVSRSEERSLLAFNLSEVLALPLAVALGALLGHIEYTVFSPSSLIGGRPSFAFTTLVVAVLVIVGFVEEAIFRGLLQQVLEDQIGQWPGLILASAVFGLMYLSYNSIAEPAFAFGFGALLGIIYDRTDGLLLVAMIHSTANYFLFLILPELGSLSALVAS